LPAFSLGGLEAGPAQRGAPVRQAVATSVSFGSTYGAVALEREFS
jgi:hypothetical protein